MVVLALELLVWLGLTGALLLRWSLVAPPVEGGWYWAIPVGILFVLGVAFCVVSLGLVVAFRAIGHRVRSRITDAEVRLEQEPTVLFRTADLSSETGVFVQALGRQLAGAGVGGRVVWWWLHRRVDDWAADFEAFCQTHEHEQVTVAILGQYVADASTRGALRATLRPLWVGRRVTLLAQVAIATWAGF